MNEIQTDRVYWVTWSEIITWIEAGFLPKEFKDHTECEAPQCWENYSGNPTAYLFFIPKGFGGIKESVIQAMCSNCMEEIAQSLGTTALAGSIDNGDFWRGFNARN